MMLRIKCQLYVGQKSHCVRFKIRPVAFFFTAVGARRHPSLSYYILLSIPSFRVDVHTITD